MPDVNFDWVHQQFTGAGVRKGTGDAVITLLKAWQDIDLPNELLEDTVDVFSHLARQEALIKNPGNEVWVQAIAGGPLQVGDQIRVRHDAYKGDEGVIHNGRRGKVVAIRSGRVIVQSTDGLKPFLDGTHYRFEALERRIR